MKFLQSFKAWRDRRALGKALKQDAKAARLAAARELADGLASRAAELKGLRIRREAVVRAKGPSPEAAQIEAYRPPSGVVPAGMAMDYDMTDYAFVNSIFSGTWAQGHFRGYQYLAMLSQQTEYRKIVETLAEEMTRKWIVLRSKGDADKSDRISKLADALDRYKVRDLFRVMAVHDGFYGRAQLYIDVKTPRGVQATLDPVELRTTLIRSSAKITKGSLVGFKAIEPVWTYPGAYNSTNPLAADFYKPRSWFVMSQEIHATRLINFVSRPVPDMLKPSYNFGGVPLSQLCEPYVENFLRTRDSVSDVVHSFSLSGIATDLSSVLQEQGDGEQMALRAQLFNEIRDTRGLLMLNKESEEFFQFNTPLSGLDALQAQAQEQMATPASLPLVKLFGITPKGLNASSDGEIKVLYDHIHASQEAKWRDNLAAVIEIVQLSEFGDVDADITFDFEKLHETDPVQDATIRKTDAETDAILITQCSAITSDESRERLIADETSPYHSLESNPQAKSIADTLSDEEQARADELLDKQPNDSE